RRPDGHELAGSGHAQQRTRDTGGLLVQLGIGQPPLLAGTVRVADQRRRVGALPRTLRQQRSDGVVDERNGVVPRPQRLVDERGSHARNGGLVRGHGSNPHWLIAHGRSAAPGRSSLYLIQIQKSADPRNKFPAKPWSHSPYTFKFLISTMQLRFRGWEAFAPKCARPLGLRAAGRAARADTRSRRADTCTERRHPVVARRYAV